MQPSKVTVGSNLQKDMGHGNVPTFKGDGPRACKRTTYLSSPSLLSSSPGRVLYSLPLGLGLSENVEVSEAAVRTDLKRSQGLVLCLYPH